MTMHEFFKAKLQLVLIAQTTEWKVYLEAACFQIADAGGKK